MVCRMVIEFRRQEEERVRYDQMKVAIAAYAGAAMEGGDESGFVASLLNPDKKGASVTNSSLFDMLPVNITTSIVVKG